jgi:riboflavin synthase
VFSGIVQTLGEIQRPVDGSLVVKPRLPFEDLQVGESVAVSGACLTVSALTADGFAADVMPETLHRTTLGHLKAGGVVNLERALRFGDRVGGHLVTGHVDATGTATALREDGNARWVTITLPDELTDLVAEKGSIAVDGISLTVVDVFESAFTVSLIPLTLRDTVAGGWTVGTRVNLEADVIARYVARVLAARTPSLAFAMSERGVVA